MGDTKAQSSVESLPDLHLPTRAGKGLPHTMGQWAKPFQADSANSKIDGVDSLVVPMEEFTRHDRMIAWSAANGLSVYAVGQNKPLFTCAGVGQAPMAGGAAWTGDGLVLWGAGFISLVDGNWARQKWSVDVSKLPDIVNAGAATPDNQNAGGSEEISQVRAGQRPHRCHDDNRSIDGDRFGAGRIAWQVAPTARSIPCSPTTILRSYAIRTARPWSWRFTIPLAANWSGRNRSGWRQTAFQLIWHWLRMARWSIRCRTSFAFKTYSRRNFRRREWIRITLPKRDRLRRCFKAAACRSLINC